MQKRCLFLGFILIIFMISCETEKPIACTEDARVCPDGSSVGRIPPDCEFEECPETPEEPVEKEPEKVVQPEEAETPEIIEIVSEPEEVIDPNLIAHWKFDDDAEDSAKSHDGTIKGNAVFAAGKKGNALSFDGVNDYIEFSEETVNEIGALSQGTIAFWFKFNSLLDKQTIMPIFYIGVEEKEPDNIFIIEVGHFDQQSFAAVPVPDPSDKRIYSTWIKNNRDPYLCFDSNINLEENKWHHYAVVVGDEGNTGYLNGVEITNRRYNFGRSSDKSFLIDIPNKKKLMLGYGRSSFMLSPDFIYFKGALDDFRIYDKALSSDEIKELAD